MKITFNSWAKPLLVLAATSLLGVVVGTAADAPAAGAPPAQRGAFRGGMLDDQQRTLLREAMQKNSDELRSLDEKLRAAQKELMKAVLAEKQDEKAVREKAEAVGKIQTELTVIRAKAFAAVTPTLKPEQKDQLENSPMGMMMMGGPGGAAFGGGMGGRGGPGGDAGGRQQRPPR